MNNTINLIKSEFPNRAVEISESLQLLKESITSTIDDISTKVAEVFTTRDFESIDKYKNLAEEGNKYEKLIEELIDLLEIENEEHIVKIEDENSYISVQKAIPNYADYQVDNQVEHTLYEDFMHKRPFGFKFIKNDIYEVRTWGEVFIKTCEILYDIDSKKFNDFENLLHMNGKKNKYFSKDIRNIRKEHKIRDGIFVETNHSANTIRNIILKMLKEYKFKASDYKVYFWADYTELNKKED